MILISLVILALVFALGKYIGQRAEAKALAGVLKIESLVSAEYRAVVKSLKAKVSREVAHVKRFLILILAVSLFGLAAAAQTVTVPPASSAKASLQWTVPSVCTASAPCTFITYRVAGTATITAGTTGATALPTTGTNASSIVDASVTPGATYSYAVETLQAGMNSAPSNTVTLTIPAAPPAPNVTQGTARNSTTVKNPSQTETAETVTTVTIKSSGK